MAARRGPGDACCLSTTACPQPPATAQRALGFYIAEQQCMGAASPPLLAPPGAGAGARCHPPRPLRAVLVCADLGRPGTGLWRAAESAAAAGGCAASCLWLWLARRRRLLPPAGMCCTAPPLAALPKLVRCWVGPGCWTDDCLTDYASESPTAAPYMLAPHARLSCRLPGARHGQVLLSLRHHKVELGDAPPLVKTLVDKVLIPPPPPPHPAPVSAAAPLVCWA
jgi:hypothetical protein